MVSAPVARTDSGQVPEVGLPAAPPSRLVMHAMFWLAGALPAYWLLQQHTAPSISRKFIWTIAAPVSPIDSTNVHILVTPSCLQHKACLGLTSSPPNSRDGGSFDPIVGIFWHLSGSPGDYAQGI